jgi:hypothetical protein
VNCLRPFFLYSKPKLPWCSVLLEGFLKLFLFLMDQLLLCTFKLKPKHLNHPPHPGEPELTYQILFVLCIFAIWRNKKYTSYSS